MKRLFPIQAAFVTAVLSATFAVASSAQTTQSASSKTDKPFKGYFYNNEYDVYLRADFYDGGINVPNHELFGPLPGYFAKKFNNFYWLITSAKVKNAHTAELSIINDYGSEDLTATLTQKNDSVFELRQTDGSALKVPNKGKWQKMPKTLELKKK